MKTYPMKVEDGKVYAEVTLRDVVERCDVSDLPILAEVKRLYDENAKLRGLVRDLYYLSDTYFEDRELYWWKPYEQRMRDLGIEVDE